MAKIDLASVRAQVNTGGIISASHMTGVYDALISGSSDDKYFGGIKINKDVEFINNILAFI